MQTRRLGEGGPRTAAIGLGCMGMSDLYGPADEREAIATIHAALDAGITLLDTGDFYGMGHNELLIRRALRGRPRDRVQLSVKFGAMRGPDGGRLGIDTRPAAIGVGAGPWRRRDPAGGGPHAGAAHRVAGRPGAASGRRRPRGHRARRAGGGRRRQPLREAQMAHLDSER